MLRIAVCVLLALSLAVALGADAGQAQVPDAEDPMAELRRELAAQRSELAAQREELAAQRAQLAARAPASADAGHPADPSGERGAAVTQSDESMSDADIDAIVAEEGAESAVEPLRLYGYMDMGFQYYWAPDPRAFISSFLETDAPTFVLGHLNLYVDAQPDPAWRALMELRFTNSPHGAEVGFASPELGLRYERTDRMVLDSSSVSGRDVVLFGSIIIERAWLEWTFRDALKLQVGYFLTPYGIWNVDHSNPVLISLYLPQALVAQDFPQRQLGIQAYGRVRLGPRTDLAYHAWVSNGRTPGQFDLTHDKALGGRVRLTFDQRGYKLAIGASGWGGTYADIEKVIVSFDPFETRREQTVDGLEWGAAADLSLDVGGFRLRAELFLSRVQYFGGLRPSVSFGRPDGLRPDAYTWDAYLVSAYRFRNSAFEPFLYFEVLTRPSDYGNVGMAPGLGLNIHFAPAVQLKTQLTGIFFDEFGGATRGELTRHTIFNVQSRLVVAY